MGWKTALSWRLPMPHLRDSRLSWRTAVRKAPLGDPIVTVQLLARLVPNRRPVAAREKDPTVLPAPCQAFQARILIPLDLGPDRVHPPRKGEDASRLGLICRLLSSPDAVCRSPQILSPSLQQELQLVISL